MATKYDQSSATRPVSIRSHTSAFQVHFKHTSSALEMSSVNPPNMAASFLVISTLSIIEIMLLERNVDSFTDLNQAFFCARKFLN